MTAPKITSSRSVESQGNTILVSPLNQGVDIGFPEQELLALKDEGATKCQQVTLWLAWISDTYIVAHSSIKICLRLYFMTTLV
jgi:hypothetical protein